MTKREVPKGQYRKADGTLTAKFYTVLKSFLKKAGGTSCEGNALLEVDITDRFTHERMHFSPLPYSPWISRGESEDLGRQKYRELLLERLHIATTNLAVAARQMDSASGELERWERKEGNVGP